MYEFKKIWPLNFQKVNDEYMKELKSNNPSIYEHSIRCGDLAIRFAEFAYEIDEFSGIENRELLCTIYRAAYFHDLAKKDLPKELFIPTGFMKAKGTSEIINVPIESAKLLRECNNAEKQSLNDIPEELINVIAHTGAVDNKTELSEKEKFISDIVKVVDKYDSLVNNPYLDVNAYSAINMMKELDTLNPEVVGEFTSFVKHFNLDEYNTWEKEYKKANQYFSEEKVNKIVDGLHEKDIDGLPMRSIKTKLTINAPDNIYMKAVTDVFMEKVKNELTGDKIQIGENNGKIELSVEKKITVNLKELQAMIMEQKEKKAALLNGFNNSGQKSETQKYNIKL